MPRAPQLLVAALLALAGCGREVPEDPAVLTPGAGIPMGAVGATGVSFDAPTARPEISPPKTRSGKPSKPPIGLAPEDPPPLDPFESPPDDTDPTPPPKTKPKSPHGPKPHSPSETTL